MLHPLSGRRDLQPETSVGMSSGTLARLPRHVHPAVVALEDRKGVKILVLDVRGLNDFADFFVIASGTSTRHVKSIADEVVRFAKKTGVMPLGVEGEREAEWVLVDLGDVVVHVMLPRVREFYALERLWTVGDQPPEDQALDDQSIEHQSVGYSIEH